MNIDLLRRMGLSAIAFVVLVLATFSVVTTSTLSAQAQKQPGKTIAFKGTVYSSIDGRTVIRMVSSDELEIATQGTNLVCKYTKQGDVIRAVVNSFGTTQAVYYQITSEGLQDKEGHIFYSPTRLETARQQAEAARQKAAEQARLEAQRQEENNRRRAALLKESLTASRVIDSFEAFARSCGKTCASSLESGKLTDVDAVGRYWLGGIIVLNVGEDHGSAAPWYVGVEYHAPGTNGSTGSGINFAEQQTRDRFVSELETAIKAWRAKYGEVAEVSYRGIK